MQLKSNKFREIKGLLRRPQSLKPKFNLDIDVKEYCKQYIKYKLYSYYSIANLNVNEKINNKGLHYYGTLNNFNKSPININQLQIIDRYKKLKASELYDESICKIGLVTIGGNYYLGFYFPTIMLQEVNTGRNPIELKDMYFYVDTYSLKGFRSTLDINNPRFVHPHLSRDFAPFCLGSSALGMSLNNLYYNFDAFDENDADIFWINLYRTVTQKTEVGDHYYALDSLNKGGSLTESAFEDIIFSDKDFLTNVHKYISVFMLKNEIKMVLNVEDLKKDYFHLFSEDVNLKKDYLEDFTEPIWFDNRFIKSKKYTTIYKGSRIFYNNIDTLLGYFMFKYGKEELINKVYDDYKEKLKESNNSGEQSVGENQVFEFQML
jgi:hypothetical protein